MEVLWEETARKPQFPQLSSSLNTDVLIIGGGICGLLCAYMLQQAGVDYALVEAESVCSGITANTTAKITVQHGFIYNQLIRQFGEGRAKQYLSANRRALEEYGKLCQGIDCDFQDMPSFVYTIDKPQEINKELLALRKLGCKVDFTTDLPLPIRVAGALRMENQAQFHPLKFLFQISDGLHIFEHTKVQGLVGTDAMTQNGTIHAKKIIITTHFPFLNKHGSYFLKLYQHRSYVIALENAPNYGGAYLDEAETGLSFRNYGNLLLLGGGSHRTGKKGGGWESLRSFARKYYPDATERYHWATQDCMSLDGVPYIGEYSKRTTGLYVAAGFNKWGMTGSMVAARLLSDMMQGKKNEYQQLFSPSRSMLRPQLAVNTAEAMFNLLTPTTPRCPHLGCALKWNPEEHTWDCPCHGSRFSNEGKVIDNPSTGDLHL